MNNETFNMILDDRLAKIRSILEMKASEYASAKDRLHNFKVGGRISNSSPELALKGMWLKHLVSVLDIIDGVSMGGSFKSDYIDEKIGDCINYLILLEALLLERNKGNV